MNIKNLIEKLKNLLQIESSSIGGWLQDIIDKVVALKQANEWIGLLENENEILKKSVEQLETKLNPVE